MMAEHSEGESMGVWEIRAKSVEWKGGGMICLSSWRNLSQILSAAVAVVAADCCIDLLFAILILE